MCTASGTLLYRPFTAGAFPCPVPRWDCRGAGTEGKKFSYFSSNANRIAYHDETTKAVDWWLRSSHSSHNDFAYLVLAAGSVSNYDVYYAYNCARPALALSSEILVSDSPDSSGCYTIEDAVIAGEQYQKVNGVWRRMC